MKDEPIPLSPGKSPRERFVELGSKIMAVPKAEIEALDKAWRAKKRRKRTK